MHRAIEWLLGVTLCLSLILSYPSPGTASIHTYPETSTQTMYRSLLSFRDSSNQAWQVVLYKRVNRGLLNSIHLRLVGFPGLVELTHPHPLQITTGTGKVWLSPDVFSELSLPANVGEYDLLEVMRQLDTPTPLRLELPVEGERFVELVIPPFAVREWLSLVAK